ncbi:MAG: hypothetical protein MUC69_00885 [Gemmatimonadales bacterium]|nr:hypothetical protein [Gemmatimonadales bacterium]
MVLVLAALFVVLVVVLLLWQGRTPPAAPSQAGSVASRETTQGRSGGAPAAGLARGGPGGPALDAGARRKDGPGPFDYDGGAEGRERYIETIKEALRIYRETMVYPQWSRPVDGSVMHLVDWRRPVRRGQQFAADKEGNTIFAYFVLDHVFVAPGETISGTLEVYKEAQGERLPVPLAEASVRIETYEGGNNWKVVAHPALQGGNGHWTTQFVPTKIKGLPLPERPARAVARVVYNTEFSKEIPVSFGYTDQMPVRVHGIAHDALVNGSLMVSLDVELKAAGALHINATLFDREGRTPIVLHTGAQQGLKAGRQRVDFVFFGRALREKGLDGPYRLKSLHGYLRVRGETATSEHFWYRDDEPPLFTKKYRAADFSDAEYSSPLKDAKIRDYENLLREASQ